MKILSVLSVCFATDSWSTAFFVYDQEVCGLREDAPCQNHALNTDEDLVCTQCLIEREPPDGVGLGNSQHMPEQAELGAAGLW